MKRVVALLVFVVAVLGFALPASAHVTVTAPGATRGGGDQEITFRVPVEKDIDTVGIVVQLPTATPIASVDVEPVPGWTHTQTTVKLAKPIITDDGDITSAVSQISWTAAKGAGLKPGEFGSFTIIAGQLPDVASLTFSTIQTYSDGSVVKWIQTAAPGSSVEPDYPAPTLELSAATAGPGTSAATKTAGQSSTTTSTVLAIIALVLAAGALGLASVTFVARRKGGA